MPRKESNDAASQPHVRPVEPVTFGEEPVGDDPGESQRRGHLRRALEEVLRVVVGPTKSTVGSARLIYYTANDPRRCLAPDAFVKHGVADHSFSVWKTWERGAPEIAFEIVSHDSGALDQLTKRYHELGVRELVVFDADAPAGRRLRVWDRIDGDFLERIVAGEQTPCFTLDCDLSVAAILVADVQYEAFVRFVRRRRAPSYGNEGDGFFIPTVDEARNIADNVRQARELAQQASLTEAQSQRDQALARGNARAEAISSSNDKRLASVKRPK